MVDGWRSRLQSAPHEEHTICRRPELIGRNIDATALAVSGITIFPRLEQPGGEILGFAFPDDGTIMMLRGMGIPKGAANPNSAKLFVDYALSQDGQTQVGKGGLVPYREDVPEDQVRYTFQKIGEIVGKDNIITAGFDQRLITEAGPFVEKWNAAIAGK
jgi:iron(III) transport system substrate-binding protein